ncbi:hypothetical protein [Stieleria sp.]|uniref:hypothetical protein n=1 Tax=Stieleria sp. TaxID=2795976 RepID=UPI00356530D3
MTTNEKIIAWFANCGVFLATTIGILVLITWDRRHASVSPTVHQTKSVGNVSVMIADPIEPTPAVMTTEQLADEIGCNADTVRRRYADGRLFGYEKLSRDAWVRVGHGSCMIQAFDVHDSGLGI